jgi:predicted transcriptional regulator
LQDADGTLGDETKAAIEEGLEDIRAGRTITLAEYRKSPGA